MIEGRELLVVQIASILDHPSVYMGGPSKGNRLRAEKIVSYLEREGIYTNG